MKYISTPAYTYKIHTRIIGIEILDPFIYFTQTKFFVVAAKVSIRKMF